MKTTTTLKLTFLLLGSVLFGERAMAQYTPTVTVPITLTENNSTPVVDYQVLLTLNTQAMVLSGALQASGADMRFSSDGCFSTALPHWVESGMNTSTTKIWVKVPALAANASETIYMFGGDPLATDVSNFAAVFPNAIITAGSNATTGGTIDIGWLQVDANDTLFITPGTLAQLSARKTKIDGVVLANGAGYASGIIGPNTGSGTGGGTSSTNAGCGGGSYGNLGGAGGYDSGDTPGAGGIIYGTNSGMDIDAGSGGGSSNNTAGGNGGGGLLIRSEEINITGQILANGDNGQLPGGTRGGGGGSGGGVLLFGHALDFSGAISADGGDGSIGVSTANDDGAGGSGGRIKIFYSAIGTMTGATTVLGGIGGPNGSAAGGEDGLVGTYFDGVQAFNPITYLFGTPGTPPVFNVAISDADTSICANDQLTFTATGTAPFDFLLNGNSVQNGASNIYATTTLNDGDTITVTAAGCSMDFEVTVFASPDATITPSVLTPVCFDDTLTLTVDPSFASYVWNTSDTTNAIAVHVNGTYDVSIVDANGCLAADTFTFTNIGTPPAIVGSLLACEGDVITLSVDNAQVSSLVWSTGDVNDTTDVTVSGSVWVQTLDVDGCTGSDTVNVLFNPLPIPTITETSGVLDAGAGYSSYQWQVSGSDIPGATAQTYTITSGGDYTVVVTDANGCSGSSAIYNSTVGLTDLDDLTVSVQPNPFQDQVSVRINAAVQDQVELVVLNQQGQRVYTEKVQLSVGDSEFNLDLSSLSKGMYYVNIVGESSQQMYKLIKQ